MKFVSRMLVAAIVAMGATSTGALANTKPKVKAASCASGKCQPAARTIVRTKYNYRTVQRVNHVTRFRDVRKVRNVYMVRNVQRVRLVRVSYVMRDLGYKRVSKAEYHRLNRGRKVHAVRKVNAMSRAQRVARDCNCGFRPISMPHPSR
jgi:hypothetical protein